MVQQVTVFVENRPGRITEIARVLAEKSVNIRALLIQDRGQFGMAKLLVDDPRKAHIALIESGFAAALKPILAVAIDDQPGGLFALTKVFLQHNVNISDAYGFVIESRKQAVYCAEVDDLARVTTAVREGGFRVLEAPELYEL